MAINLKKSSRIHLERLRAEYQEGWRLKILSPKEAGFLRAVEFELLSREREWRASRND